MLRAPLETPKCTETKLLSDEENALRYASGYIGMKHLKRLSKVKGSKAAQFRECLSAMSRQGNDTSFYAYTTEWINTVNRGGLFSINDATFEFFKAMEVKTRQILPKHLAQPAALSKKEDLVESISLDEAVQLSWTPVAIDIVDVEHSKELLTSIVEMWLTMRGFSITSNWMDQYKLAIKDKLISKSKSLRKELNS